jgi:hypothetical protein
LPRPSATRHQCLAAPTKLRSCLDGEIKQKQAALSTLIGAVRPDPRTLSGVGTALDKNPRAVTLVRATRLRPLSQPGS